jgi:hypothetical protein
MTSGGTQRPGDSSAERAIDRRPNPFSPRSGSRLWKWLAGLAVATLGAIITSALTGLPSQVIDVNALKDRIRPGSDFSSTVDIVYLDDEAYSITVPGNHAPSPLQERLMSRLDNVSAPELVDDLRRAGGVDVDDLTIRVVVRGRSNQGVQIVGMRPIVRRRTPPLTGTLFHIPPQAGAASIRMIVNFDQPIAVLREVRGSFSGPRGGRPFFDENSIKLADGEQDVLVIRAVTSRYSISFVLEVTYLLGNAERTVTIDDHGQPFRVTGTACDGAPRVATYERFYDLVSGSQGLTLAPVANPTKSTQAHDVCR